MITKTGIPKATSDIGRALLASGGPAECHRVHPVGVAGEGGIPMPGELAEGGIVEFEVHLVTDFDQQIEEIEFAAAQDCLRMWIFVRLIMRFMMPLRR